MKSPRIESTRSSWIPLCDVRNHNKHEDMEGDDQQHQIQKFGDHKFPEVQVPEGNKWFVKSWQLLMADTRTTINNREETIANNTTPFVQHGFWHVRVLEEKSWPRNSKKYRRILSNFNFIAVYFQTQTMSSSNRHRCMSQDNKYYEYNIHWSESVLMLEATWWLTYQQSSRSSKNSIAIFFAVFPVPRRFL